jgi:hypothetical protein
MFTPRMRNRHPGGIWAADSGCYNRATYLGDDAYLRFLDKYANTPGCLFATAPDVVGDHAATLQLWDQWHPKLADRDYTPAFVCQDGATVDTVPWDTLGAVFVGGTTEWKLGPDALQIVGTARKRGVWTHMGRVNSGKRFRYAQAIGCDSVDGTLIAFGPDQHLPRVIAWGRQEAVPGL